MKSPFPSPVELAVASALLLLSETPPSICPPPPPKRCFDGDSVKNLRQVKVEERSVSAESKSSGSSSLTSDGSTANNIRELQIRRLNLQVARKSRSKVCVISDVCWNSASGITVTAPSASDLTEVSSLSITSSAASSSARNRYSTNQPKRDEHKRKYIGSTHLRRKAQSILKLLSCGGSSSEIKIRQMLGDSPDTSKALRMLLKRDEIRRYGNGGRIDPYVYTIAA